MLNVPPLGIFGGILAQEYFILAYTVQVDSVFKRNLICSPVSEYPALFTSEQNKMASRFVYVTGEELFFNKRSCRARLNQKSNKIWQ